jgi:hypothetical protein
MEALSNTQQHDFLSLIFLGTFLFGLSGPCANDIRRKIIWIFNDV